MAVDVPERKLATLTIPAQYLADLRTAAVRETHSDSDGLRLADEEDRGFSARILRRSMALVDDLLAATGDVTLTAAHDNTSGPLVHLLEEFVRMTSERLRDVSEYAPMPMGDVLDVAERLRWAAEEAVRICPGAAHTIGGR